MQFIVITHKKNSPMKNCPNCHEEMEDNFDVCWNCNFSISDNKILEFESDSEAKRKINCLRCPEVQMIPSGVYNFHEGTNYGVFGNLMEMFNNRESFDLYICPKCGKVELFSPR